MIYIYCTLLSKYVWKKSCNTKNLKMLYIVRLGEGRGGGLDRLKGVAYSLVLPTEYTHSGNVHFLAYITS
jgi:hypothetical protein